MNCPNGSIKVISETVTDEEGKKKRVLTKYVYDIGSCLYCPEGTCTRPEAKPCRHPELVRPSLEACGFDIARTTSELFGIELKWGTDGSLPEYLTLVCGFFHNAENIIWNG